MQHLVKLLTLDERDYVADLVRHDGWKPLLEMVEQLVSDQESAVLRLQINDGVEALVHAKLKAEGARKLSADVARLKELFKDPKGLSLSAHKKTESFDLRRNRRRP